MSRRKRFSVTATDRGCTLVLHGDYGTSGESSTHHFWCPAGAGYAYEEYEGRPGTSGRQVCDSLFGLGSTLYCTRRALPAEIRRRARAYCDWCDRNWCDRHSSTPNSEPKP